MMLLSCRSFVADAADTFAHHAEEAMPNMQKRLNVTAVRWFVAYSSIFALAVSALLALICFSVTHTMENEADGGLRWQLRYFDSSTDTELVPLIRDRIRRETGHHNYYGVFDASGARLVGNLATIPPGLPFEPYTLSRERAHGKSFSFDEDMDGLRAMGEIRPDGRRFVVATTLTDVDRVRDQLLRASIASGMLCLALGIGAALMLSLRQMRRVFEIRRVTQRIASGDLSQRLPVTGNDELAMLACLVNQMLDDIERLMGEVKSASDVVAHDLRTPLAQLKTRLSTLIDACEKGKTVDLEQALGRARDDTEHLLMRFSAMLSISEIGVMQRRSGFMQVSLTGLVAELCDLYGPLAEARAIRVAMHLERADTIRADRALLFEAFSNLLDNALKFTPSGGSVTIELRRRPEGLQFVVADSGPGIPPDEREKVLTRFYRSARTRHLHGTGLGLAIVMAIVRLHDFGLRIGASEQGGTRIDVDCWSHLS